MVSLKFVFYLLEVLMYWAATGQGVTTGPCYGTLGCFNNTAPWNTLMRPAPVPQSPQTIGTAFFMYSRASPERFYVSNPKDGEYSTAGFDFDGSKKTVFVIHGLVELGQEQLMDSIKDAVLVKVDANVVIVYWADGAVHGDFLQVASNARVVGAVTAQFVQYLIASQGAAASRMHLIGWGPGAHVAGYVGKAVQGVGRITGNLAQSDMVARATKIATSAVVTALDASRHAFEGLDPRVRLDAADALFVDAVHTDAGFLGLGAEHPVGHVDVYVNGGWHQEGCLAKIVPKFFTGTYDIPGSIRHAFIKATRCRQERAVELFTASLRNDNCTFWAHKASGFDRALSAVTGGAAPLWLGVPCTEFTCSPLGYDSVNYPARGVFDVSTASLPPYCMPDFAAEVAMLPYFST